MEALSWLIVAVVIATCFLLFRSRRRNLPPGPYSWPIFGSIFSLKQPLHRHFAHLARVHGPVLYLRVGMLRILVVNDATTAKEVLKAKDLDFVDRPRSKLFELFSLGFKDMVFSSYGESWRMTRRISSVHMFNANKLNATSSQRADEVRSVVQSVLTQHPSVDVRRILGEYNANIVCRMLFGKTMNSGASRVVEVIEKMTGSAKNVNIGELFPALDRFDLHGMYRHMREVSVPQLKCILGELIQERIKDTDQSGRRKDFLDALMEEGLEQDQIMAMLMDMISAGVETSQAVAEWAMAEVMQNQGVVERAQRELDERVGKARLVKESDVEELPYIQAIVKETLRLHPVLPLGLPHFNTKASSIAGYHVPAKCQVLVNIWAIGRDSSHWGDDTDAFRPERFLGSEVSATGQNFELLPFSAGRRICVGYPLAMRSIPLVVATLLHAFEWKRTGTLSLEEGIGNVTCKLQSKLTALARPRLEENAYNH